MQLFASKSEEFGESQGFDFISGSVIKLKTNDKTFKVPHIGWNSINSSNDSTLFSNKMPDERFYFVHSYYVNCFDKRYVVATTEYGDKFDSVICKKNICGVQFHPEKSHIFGLKFFENYLSKI